MATGSVQIKKTKIHSEYALWICRIQDDGSLRLRFDCKYSNDQIDLVFNKEEREELLKSIAETTAVEKQ